MSYFYGQSLSVFGSVVLILSEQKYTFVNVLVWREFILCRLNYNNRGTFKAIRGNVIKRQ